jgi:hypothetical protein
VRKRVGVAIGDVWVLSGTVISRTRKSEAARGRRRERRVMVAVEWTVESDETDMVRMYLMLKRETNL